MQRLGSWRERCRRYPRRSRTMLSVQSSSSAFTSAARPAAMAMVRTARWRMCSRMCGLEEVTAEGFAGGANGLCGLHLGFAFAGGEQFDGAAGLLGDSAGLVDGLDWRSGLD